MTTRPASRVRAFIPPFPHLPRAAASLLLVLLSAVPASAQITWNVTFNDQVNTTGIGFDDPTLGATRRATFQSIFTYLNTQLDARGPVNFTVNNSFIDGSSLTLASA